MYIEQLYTNCLAHAAYYVEDGGEAVVIDPLRNPEQYVKLAKQRGAKIKYVFETHFHADFVSGHIDLANETGAIIVYGPNATPGYKAYIANDEEAFRIGTCTLKVLHTPGHTIESSCFLLFDANDKPHAIFTGDTLFVGDVGRPDLLSGNLPKEELATMLFHSLMTKIKVLPDNVLVYPGHGAGSACGKNIGIEAFSTIGQQKLENYALRISSLNEFIAAVTNDLPHIPAYFFKDAALNKQGYQSYAQVVANSCNSLNPVAFAAALAPDTIVLDTRDAQHFGAAFIEGSINIGLNGDFAVWVGTLVPANASLLLVADINRVAEAVERLARIGYDNVLGYLEGGIESWLKDGRRCNNIKVVEPSNVEQLIVEDEYTLLDVRNRREVAHNRVAGSLHIPLTNLQEHLHEFDVNHNYLVYCAGGYRSMIAASLLMRFGCLNVASIDGGIKEIIRLMPHLVDIDAE